MCGRNQPLATATAGAQKDLYSRLPLSRPLYTAQLRFRWTWLVTISFTNTTSSLT